MIPQTDSRTVRRQQFRTGTITPSLDELGQQKKNGVGVPMWRLRFYAQGKRRHHVLPFPTQEDASAWIQAQRSGGETTTWLSVLAAWSQVHTGAFSESHLAKVERSVRLLVKRLGDLPIESTDAGMLKQYLRWRIEDQGAAAAKKDLAHVKALARWARGDVMIEEIPFEHISPPPHKEAKRTAVPLETIPALLATLDEWLRPIALWCALSGCRQQDAARLLEEDCTTDVARCRVKGGEMVDYALDDTLREVLSLAREQKRKHGITSQWVFVHRLGGRWVDTHLSHRIKEAWQDIGPWRLHHLRHTFGTIAGRKFKADMIKAGLAHKSRLTSERYVHVSEDADARLEVGSHVRSVIAKAILDGTQDGTQRDTDRHKAAHGKAKENTIAIVVDGRKALIPRHIAYKYLVE